MSLVGSLLIRPSVSTLSVIFDHDIRNVTILNLVPEKLSANGKTNETDCGFTQEGFS